MGWVVSSDVAEALGPVQPGDQPWLDRCTAAANQYAFERRQAAGYADLPDVSPGPRAEQGTILYAVALFRERGSVDSFASFEEFAVGVPPPSTFGQVNRLLGIPRPAVDSVDTDFAFLRLPRHRAVR